MELVQILQISSIFGIFILTALCALLPLKLFPRKRKTLSARSQRILSWCNCFSGGVFLGACFIQLVPYLTKKFVLVYQTAGWDIEVSYAMTQLTVMGGFFLIVVTEQVVHVCRKENPNADTNEHQMLPVSYASSSASTGSDDSDTETLLDKRRLKKNKRLSHNSNSRPKTQSQNHGHSHSHQAHGHSHMPDIVGNSIGLRSIILWLALGIHSIFEGLALGLQDETMPYVNLLIGVIAHEVLMAFALGVNLAKQKIALCTVVPLIIVFSLTIPIGMAAGIGLGEIHTFSGALSAVIIQGIAAGTFLYVIFFEILPPEIEDSKDRLLKSLFMLFGFGLIACLKFSLDG